MNVPFLGKHGVAYGGTTGETSPSNMGDHIGTALEDGRKSVTGINNNYGNTTDFAKSCGLIFQKEAAAVVEAIGPQVQVTSGDVSVVYQGDVILGRLAMGVDFLNPAAAVELYVGGTAPAKFGGTYPENG